MYVRSAEMTVGFETEELDAYTYLYHDCGLRVLPIPGVVVTDDKTDERHSAASTV